MRKVILMTLCLCTAWLSHGQPTPEYPLTLDGQLEDQMELCSSPVGDVFYFLPFKATRAYMQSDAMGLAAFNSASASSYNGLIEMRDIGGNLLWSNELVNSTGEFRVAIRDYYDSSITLSPTPNWDIEPKAYDINYDPVNELVVVAATVDSLTAPTPFGMFGGAVTQQGLHLFFFDPASGLQLLSHRVSGSGNFPINNQAIVKDMQIGNQNGYLYLAYHDINGEAGVIVYDLGGVMGGTPPIYINDFLINENASPGNFGITEIALDPHDPNHEQVFIGGTFSDGSIDANSGPITPNVVAGNTVSTSYMLALNINSPSPWTWVRKVVVDQGRSRTVGVDQHIPFNALSGEQGFPVLVGHTEGTTVVFGGAVPSFSPTTSISSYIVPFRKSGGAIPWGSGLNAYQASAIGVNGIDNPGSPGDFVITGTIREDAATDTTWATLAIDINTRHAVSYRFGLTLPSAKRWESWDVYGSGNILRHTDVEFNGKFCYPYGRFYDTYVLDNGDQLYFIGGVSVPNPIDVFILRLEATTIPIVINTRLAAPNDPTAANNQGDYQQTGAGLPGLGKSAQELLLFPNPVTRNALYLQAQATGATQLRISNMAGQIIWERALLPAQNDLHVPTADWPSGVYVLSYLDALGEMQNVKIQVMR